MLRVPKAREGPRVFLGPGERTYLQQNWGVCVNFLERPLPEGIQNTQGSWKFGSRVPFLPSMDTPTHPTLPGDQLPIGNIAQ